MKPLESLDRYFTRSGSFPQLRTHGIRELKFTGLYMDFVALRARVTGIFGVKNFSEIPAITKTPEALARVKTTYDERFSLQFPDFADESIEARANRYKKYSETADSIIDNLSKDFLGQDVVAVDLTNELRDIHHPVDLMTIIFNKDEYRTTRFEAYRKLVLMEYAQDIDYAASQYKGSIDEINYFLDQNLLSKDQKRGAPERVFIVSHLNPETYECANYTTFNTRQEARVYQQQYPGTKLDVLPVRRLTEGNRKIFLHTRKKLDISQVVKLLRKRSHEPTEAVQDVFGVFAVVETYRDVKKIVEQFIRAAQTSGSEIEVTDIEDSIQDGKYSAENGGSSKDFKVCKLQVKFHGLKVEVIIHTIKTYLDSLYQRGVSRDEFEAKRVFETGVIERLFPPEIYDLDDIQTLYQQAIARARAKIEKDN
ncbi:MAG: hypothetical protein HYV37_01860 [Candidatus Levyibacteriota bacterium]|nr:MAG: hypothetical protein HYV37_01860 [Candidatus Levybacteria bacterium]